MNTFLEHEQFEGAKILAEIGTKIAAGRAAILELESGKRDFLEGREAEAIARVDTVLAQSKELIAEIGKYHSELVGYRAEVESFLNDVLYLIQSVEHWKRDFDSELAAKSAEIDAKVEENTKVLAEIKRERALVQGEKDAIANQRGFLRTETARVNDEWAALGRAAKEINGKK